MELICELLDQKIRSLHPDLYSHEVEGIAKILLRWAGENKEGIETALKLYRTYGAERLPCSPVFAKGDKVVLVRAILIHGPGLEGEITDLKPSSCGDWILYQFHWEEDDFGRDLWVHESYLSLCK